MQAPCTHPACKRRELRARHCIHVRTYKVLCINFSSKLHEHAYRPCMAVKRRQRKSGIAILRTTSCQKQSSGSIDNEMDSPRLWLSCLRQVSQVLGSFHRDHCTPPVREEYIHPAHAVRSVKTQIAMSTHVVPRFQLRSELNQLLHSLNVAMQCGIGKRGVAILYEDARQAPGAWGYYNTGCAPSSSRPRPRPGRPRR